MPQIDDIRLRRGTLAEWQAANPVLSAGEVGLITDLRTFVVGDGVTAFTGAQKWIDRDRYQSFTHHFDGTIGPFTWANYLTTPAGIANNFTGLTGVWHTAAAKHFAYYGSYSTNVVALLAPARMTQIYSGVRLDDGTDDNYSELLAYTTTSGLMQLVRRTRTGGGTPSISTLFSGQSFLPQFLTLQIGRVSNQYSFFFVGIDTPFPVVVGSATVAGTYTQKGIVHEQVNAGSDIQSASWFAAFK